MHVALDMFITNPDFYVVISRSLRSTNNIITVELLFILLMSLCPVPCKYCFLLSLKSFALLNYEDVIYVTVSQLAVVSVH